MKAIYTLTFRAAALGLLSCLMVAGCSKKEEPARPAPPPVEPSAAVNSSTPVQQQAAPLAGTLQPDQWMNEARTYQAAGDYDKAAQYLLSIQQQQLDQAQAAAYWKQMDAFQADLATRVASGDPSAKAAAARLRASAGR